MVNKAKNDGQITCHMPSAYVTAIQNLNLNTGLSVSEWMRDVVIDHLNNERLQAKNMLAALESIESDESYKSAGSYTDER